MLIIFIPCFLNFVNTSVVTILISRGLETKIKAIYLLSYLWTDYICLSKILSKLDFVKRFVLNMVMSTGLPPKCALYIF